MKVLYLRVPSGVHHKIAQAAKRNSMSVNKWIGMRLETIADLDRERYASEHPDYVEPAPAPDPEPAPSPPTPPYKGKP